jgi:hypothetical protein
VAKRDIRIKIANRFIDEPPLDDVGGSRKPRLAPSETAVSINNMGYI